MRLPNVKFKPVNRSFLRHFRPLFLYLIIYTALTGTATGQNLRLEIDSQQAVSKSLADSLGLPVEANDTRTLQQTVDSVRIRLRRWGYLQSDVGDLYKNNDSVFTLSVIPGPRYKVLKVRYNPSSFDQAELRRISRSVESDHFYLRFPDTENALSRLSELKAKYGKPFARIRLSEFRHPGIDTLEATLNISEGQRRLIDSLVVRGYDKFPASFIKYYAGIRTGQPFDRQRINRKNDVLDGLGFAGSLKPPEVLFEADKTTLFLYLQKQNNNLFDGILGFTTDEESGDLRLNGYLNLELNNNLNYGEQLLINYKADGREQQNFRVRTQLPYLFGTPVGAELELRIFKRDSTFSTTDQSARLTYQISPMLSGYAGYKGVQSSNLQNDLLAGAAVEDYSGSFVQAGLRLAIPKNDLLWPLTTFAELASEFGNRERSTRTDDQTRISLEAYQLFRLNYNNAIFVRNLTSALFSDSYLTNELFRFGGIINLRGFDENSIDATLFSVLNTEYRYRFNEGFYAHSIIDLAYFENEINQQNEQLYSFGFGFGFLTKAGVLRLNVANGNSSGQNFRFSNTKIHISLTSKF